jgi:hypothetical protein
MVDWGPGQLGGDKGFRVDAQECLSRMSPGIVNGWGLCVRSEKCAEERWWTVDIGQRLQAMSLIGPVTMGSTKNNTAREPRPATEFRLQEDRTPQSSVGNPPVEKLSGGVVQPP